MKKTAFTLVETMVAVSILTIAVSGAFFAANSALVAAAIARDQLTASYLAQESIEYIRTVRDNAYLNDPTTGWSSFLNQMSGASSCTGPNGCELDPASAAPLQSCNGACQPLYLAAGMGAQYYTTQTSLSGMAMTPTPFTRTIHVTLVTSNDVRIVSTVTWQYHTRTYSVSVTDHLTPWQ